MAANFPKTGGIQAGQFTELRQRIFFLLGALIVYRIGTFIPCLLYTSDAADDNRLVWIAGVGGAG